MDITCSYFQAYWELGALMKDGCEDLVCFAQPKWKANSILHCLYSSNIIVSCETVDVRGRRDPEDWNKFPGMKRLH
jgi:hypothetical protein